MKNRHIKLKTIILVLPFLFQNCIVAHLSTIKERPPESLHDYYKYLAKTRYETTFSIRFQHYIIDSISCDKYALNIYKVQHVGKVFVMQTRMNNKIGDFVGDYEQRFGEINRTRVLENFPVKLLDTNCVNTKLKLKNELTLIDIIEN